MQLKLQALLVSSQKNIFQILGGITSIQKHVGETTSRLKSEIHKFVNFISVLALIMATFFFLVGSVVTR